jgi:hypothetical protein
MLNKQDREKIKQIKKEMLIEEALRKKSLNDVISNIDLLEQIIIRINKDPSLVAELVTKDGTTLRLKTKVERDNDSVRNWG